jgi:outer membrane immunogenic protein
MTAAITGLFALSATAYADTDFSWTGLYAGVHIGGGHETTNLNDDGTEATLINCCFLVDSYYSTGPLDATRNGGLAGVQFGAMYQLQQLVFGVDVDLSKTNFNSRPGQSWVPDGESDASGTETLAVTTRWTATQTLNLGYAVGRWMAFGKAGLAEASNKYSLSLNGTGNAYGAEGGSPINFAATANSTLVGPTIGAGVKWAFLDHMFLNAEYDFMDFGSNSNHYNGTFGSYGPGTLTTSVSQNMSLFKVGLNYKF